MGPSPPDPVAIELPAPARAAYWGDVMTPDAFMGGPLVVSAEWHDIGFYSVFQRCGLCAVEILDGDITCCIPEIDYLAGTRDIARSF